MEHPISISERITAPTPKFFRRLRNIGIALATISGVIATAPVSLPPLLITIAGYLTVAGSILGAVSQLPVEKE